MPGPGRNQPCPCGSGRKTKRCCGQQRGPSDEQLARAHLATLAHDAIHDLADLSDQALDMLWEGLFDLPTIDLSLHVKLPDTDHPRTATTPRRGRRRRSRPRLGRTHAPSPTRSTPHNNAPDSPTRSCASATSTA